MIRDINPRVKAYVDFNIMLLRISKTREEYVKLAQTISPTDTKEFKHRIEIISDKIKNDENLPEPIRCYYLENINTMGLVYLRTNKNWQYEDSAFYKSCRYDQQDPLFFKLQKYARSGNLISTIGKIQDLAFLQAQPFL